MTLTIDDQPEMKPTVRHPAVCDCGHTTGRHQATGRGWVCYGARESCRCARLREVLRAENGRVFMYGPGSVGHPLVMGIISLRNRDVGWTWLPGFGRCEVESCDEEMKTAVYLGDGEMTQLRCKEHAA